jgi:hypothetical protein
MPAPPATTNAPVVAFVDAVVSAIFTLPEFTYRAYAFVIVIFVDAVGAPDMNKVDAFVVVTEVLVAEIKGAVTLTDFRWVLSTALLPLEPFVNNNPLVPNEAKDSDSGVPEYEIFPDTATLRADMVLLQPIPPVTTNAPVVVLLDMPVSAINTLPELTYNA